MSSASKNGPLDTFSSYRIALLIFDKLIYGLCIRSNRSYPKTLKKL